MIIKKPYLLLVLLMAISLPVSAQFPTISIDEMEPVEHEPQRLPNGDLNISGFWITPGGLLDVYHGPSGVSSAPPGTERNVRRRLTDIPELKPPYEEMYQYAIDNPVDRGLACLHAGMPAMMGGVYGLEIIQTPELIAITSEWGPYTRRIWLNEEHPPVDEINPTFAGHSVGHWEGDILVVDTIGLREDYPLHNSGLPHSTNTRIVERYTMVKPGVMVIEFTIIDPEVFVTPWERSSTFKYEPDFRIQEYVCTENNRSIE